MLAGKDNKRGYSIFRSCCAWRTIVGLMVFFPLFLQVTPAGAVPQDGQIAAGSGTISQTSPKVMQINQASDKLIINWRSFGIAADEAVRFNQPSAGAVALNRVLGSDPSNIYGQLSANGKIFLVNPNGILFGSGAKVDVGGIVASTLNIADSDFLAGRYTFSRNGATGSVVNQGNLSAADRGYIALLAPEVRNEGILYARMGTIALAGGERITLDMVGDGLINLAIDRATLSTSIINRQLIRADGGQVILSAKAAYDLAGTVVNNEGIIEAKSIRDINGTILLEGNAVLNSGTLNASGMNHDETGGTIHVLGDSIRIAGSSLIDVTGNKGGGTVLIGGDYQGKNPSIRNAQYTFIDKNASIYADAVTEGNGGRVVVWADQDTTFSGTITARGGLLAGDGGFAEVSGKKHLQYFGFTDLTSPRGKTGELLLDPTNYTIGTDITGAALESQLNASNITIQTSDGGAQAGDITVNEAVAWTSGNTLTLKAHNDININQSLSSTGGGNLVLRADADGNNTGTVTFAGAGSVSLTGGIGGKAVFLYYNPANYLAATYNADIVNFNAQIAAGTRTYYMLVNDVTHLQNISTNLAGSYALGKDIDASATSAWNGGAGFAPIGNDTARFTGIFDGSSHVINGLTINRSGDQYVGLFGYTTNGSTVRNVGIQGGSVTGSFDVGGLVGLNSGNVANSFVTANVTGRIGLAVLWD